MFWIDNGFYGINPAIPTVKCSNCKQIFHINAMKQERCPSCEDSVERRIKSKDPSNT